MKHLVLHTFAAVLCAFACGCRTSYKDAVAARNDMIYGSGEYAVRRATNMVNSVVNKQLGHMELGRIRMLQGDFTASSSFMAPQLEDLFDDSNEGPILKKGVVAGNILAATLGDDRAIPYQLPAFELLLGLQYQAVNSLCLGKPDDARVYIMRATAAQTQIKEEIEEAHAKDTEDEPDADAQKYAANSNKALSDISQKLDPVANAVRASYENALAWYLMGLFLEKENDPSNAAIAYKEAAAISPAISSCTKAPGKGGRDVIVVYEEDFVDMKEPIKIPLPFGGTVWGVDFPVYNAPAKIPSHVNVEVGGALSATCVPVVNVQALAYRDLKDHLPGIVTRNITRAAVKIAAQQVANHVNTGNSYANLAIQLGVLAYNTTRTVIDEADTRAWQTVPEHVHLARLGVPATAKSLTLRNTSTGRSCDIPLPDGAGTTIVWFTDARGFATVTVMPFKRQGAATWARTESLLAPPPMPHTTRPRT